MSTLLISPWSRFKGCAKNYPYWGEVCDKLKDDYQLVQLGVAGEEILPHTIQRFGLSLKEVENAITEVGRIICVDNFAHHCSYVLGVRAVVIWGPSDPEIFGHKENINLLKTREYLRKDQFGYWKDYKWEYMEKGWVSTDEIVKAVNEKGYGQYGDRFEKVPEGNQSVGCRTGGTEDGDRDRLCTGFTGVYDGYSGVDAGTVR